MTSGRDRLICSDRGDNRKVEEEMEKDEHGLEIREADGLYARERLE